MAFKIPNFYAQNKKAAFARGPEASTVPSPLNISYDDAYDAQSDEKKSKQSKEEFKKAAKDYNTKAYGTTEPTKAAEENKLNDTQKKKLIVEKLKASKTRKDTAAEKEKNAKKVTEPKVTETTKTDEDKKVTPKNARRARRAERIRKRKAKRKGIKEVNKSGLKGKAKREAKEAVRVKVGKTKVGKFLKKAKDKVVGDALGNEVAKDSPAEMKDPKYFGLGKDDGTGRKIKKANKTLKQISKMQNKRSSIKDTYSGDPDDKMPEQVRTADKPASKRETRKIKKYKKTKEQLGDKIAKSPDMIK